MHFYPINNGTPNIKILKSRFKTRISAGPIILQSIAIMLFITNITFNKYIAKVFSFNGLGPLIFGFYLISDNSIIRAKSMKNILNI